MQPAMVSQIQVPLLAATPAQLGVWAAQNLDPQSPKFNCGSYFQLTGPLDISSLAAAVTLALEETECLRVQLTADLDVLQQQPRPTPADPVEFASADSADSAITDMRLDMLQPLDVLGPGLTRYVLYTVAPDQHLLYFRYHHILLDGLGQALHAARIAEHYSALTTGTSPQPSGFKPLAQCVEKALAYQTSPSYYRDREYWCGELSSHRGQNSMGQGGARPQRTTVRSTIEADQDLQAKLDDLVKTRSLRISVLLIAAAAIYQSRFTGEPRVTLTIPLPARPGNNMLGTPGMFANELPLDVDIGTGTTLLDAIDSISRRMAEILRHQRFRQEEITRAAHTADHAAPPVGTVVNVVTFDTDPQFAGLETATHHLSSGPVEDLKFDFFSSDGKRLLLRLDAKAERYAPGVTQGHQGRFMEFLRTLVGQPKAPVNTLTFLTNDEARDVELAGCGPSRKYELGKPLHGYVLDQARATPDAIAVTDRQSRLTYKELVARASGVSIELGNRGVRPGDAVGVSMSRSVDLAVGHLAVLMTGAAFVPLDPEWPSDRAVFCVEDAQISVVLGDSGAGHLLSHGINVLHISTVGPAPAGTSHVDVSPRGPAYIIYTSGSTGRPKGVAVPHEGIVNRLLWMQDEFDLAPHDCVLQKTPSTFDVSVWEFFWPLMTGARVHFLEPGAHRDPRRIAAAVVSAQVSVMHFVPPMLELFLDEPACDALPSVRLVICSGEALRTETVARFLDVFGEGPSAPALHNLYGPTEGSIDVTHWQCHRQSTSASVPIGRPVANVAVRVLDAHGLSVPFDVPGELCLIGCQVALGYLNRPDLTEEKFGIDHATGQRSYMTGDIVTLARDGVLRYLGRRDDQVKVRGFRIELGEIEAALAEVPWVTQAAVVAVADTRGTNNLVAHIVAPLGAQMDTLRDQLATKLPDYMVPGLINVVTTMPLTPHGKVDRSALPALTLQLERPGPSIGILSTTERRVADTFAKVIGLSSVNADASFFALGGDSMLAIRLRALLEAQGLTFDLSQLYIAPSVRALSRLLVPATSQQTVHTAPFSLLSLGDRALLPPDLDDAYPLSKMQSAMVYHASREAHSSLYRVVTSITIALPLNPGALRRAIHATFRRHPSLRMSVDLVAFSEPLQLIHRNVDVAIQFDNSLADLCGEDQARAVREWAEQAKFHRFDLADAPPVFFRAQHLGGARFQLTVVEHHVVLDGWSDATMLDEICQRYASESHGEELWLPALGTTYRDFIAVERKALEEPQHREFWRNQLGDAETSPLPCPTSGVEPSATRIQSDVPLPASIGRDLAAVARGADVSLKTVLTAVHLKVLSAVTSNSDVISGVVSHARLVHLDSEAAIGVFLNTLPVRVNTQGLRWADLLAQVSDWEKRAISHRAYPFAAIAQDMPDVIVDSYVNFMDFHQGWEKSDLVTGGFGIAETDFALTANFLAEPTTGLVTSYLDYDPGRLAPGIAARLPGYYRNAMLSLVEDRNMLLAATELRAPKEISTVREWSQGPTLDDTAIPGLQELLAQQVRSHSNGPAVLDGSGVLTYARLQERVGRLASYISAQGVQRGDRVGVCVHRNQDLVVSLLAIIAAGAAYVPLDPDFPSDRLEYIAGDARLRCLIVNADCAPFGCEAPLISLDRDSQAIDTMPIQADLPRPRPSDPMYVIYTSGSTGNPKGTVLTHGNVLNFFAAMDASIGIAASDRILALTSVSFDISVLELLWPLVRGATVFVAPGRMIERLGSSGPGTFRDLCDTYQPTLIQSTPSFLSAVAANPEALSGLSRVNALLVGGEAFPAGLAQRLLKALPGTRVINMYGPTETTIWSTTHELDAESIRLARTIPIGRPIANTSVRIVGPDSQDVPIGASGELWIGGLGVAQGYFERDELTSEKFVTPSDAAPERYYRTGDRVRWREDGILEFLGRMDRQVKLLGQRIELDEIESVLSQHPQVAAAAITLTPRHNGRDEIVAYVSAVSHDGGPAGKLSQWKDIWDGVYTESDVILSRFAGWESSYTGEPIPEHEMREWLDDTVDRVRRLPHDRVVDVGAGVGLVLERLAPDTSHYLAIDTSPHALRAAKQHAPQLPGKTIEFRVGDALSISALPDASADLVILNSVVQYFPDARYLTEVLSHALRVAGPRGAVFVGDVRDLRLLPHFHADVQTRRMAPTTPDTALRSSVQRMTRDEVELCLAPAYFTELVRNRPGTTVRVESKQGHFRNEMTRFRWDITLVGPLHPQLRPEFDAIPCAWSDVSALSTEGLIRRLAQMSPNGATVTDAPDARLLRPSSTLELLKEDTGAVRTAWDIQRRAWEADEDPGLDPAEVLSLAAALGVRAAVSPASSGLIGHLDVTVGPTGPSTQERT